MSENRVRKSRVKGGKLLPLITVVLAVAAAAAAGRYLFFPAGTLPAAAVVSRANSSHSSLAEPESSSEASTSSSSAPASSSSAAEPPHTGSYTDFKSAVFIGDSITSGISLYGIADTAGVFTSDGMSAATALTKKIKVDGNDTLAADAVKKADPTRIYLLLGANDITWMSGSTFIADYGKLIDALRGDAPNAVLYVQSILPVTASYETKSKVTNDKIDGYNQKLAELCSEKGVKYVDVGKALKGADGKLPGKYAASGYNITKSAYTEWLGCLLQNE